MDQFTSVAISLQVIAENSNVCNQLHMPAQVTPLLPCHPSAKCLRAPSDIRLFISMSVNLSMKSSTPALTAQSGASSTLQRMRRGYTREAYDALVSHARDVIPGVALSTDIITGGVALRGVRSGPTARLHCHNWMQLFKRVCIVHSCQVHR